MLRLSYGYTIDQNGRIIIHQAEAEIVKMIFQSYQAGDSLGKIADQLSEKKIPSPTGKDGWSKAVIDKLLSNGKCVPHIISIDGTGGVVMGLDRERVLTKIAFIKEQLQAIRDLIFRNKVVYGYQEVLPERVYEIITAELVDFERFINIVLNLLNEG